MPPSDWLTRFAHLIEPGQQLLDLACGRGRHVRWLAARGVRVTAVDRDAAAIDALRPCAEVIVTDLESGPWPLADRRFDAVLVTNYLWRARWAELIGAVTAGGLLIYETFGAEQGRVGKPSRPDFLLQPGELLARLPAPEWRIIAYEDGWLEAPRRHVQRVAARRRSGCDPAPDALIALSA